MVVSSPPLFAACSEEVCWVTGGVAGIAVVTVTVGTVPVFGIVVQAETQASRITSATKRKEYRWNFMLLNSKDIYIFFTILCLLQSVIVMYYHNPESAAGGEKLLCPPALTFHYAHFCVP